MKNKLKLLFRSIIGAIKFIKMERKYKTSLSFYIKWKTLSKGFISSNYINYNFKENKYSDYISDWKRITVLNKINSGYDSLINDKVLFHSFFFNNSLVVKSFAYIINNKLIDAYTGEIIDDKEKFLTSLKEDIIIKPSRGGGGRDVTLLKLDELHSKDTLNKFYNIISTNQDYVIQNRVVQDGFSSIIAPHSLNTVRILVGKNKYNKPFIITAVQRFGTKKSNSVDNWSSGGISVAVDTATGILGKGVVYPYNGKLEWLVCHPDTGEQFFNKKIENWEAIKDGVLGLSSELFFLNYLGWDVIPLSNGFKILESNSNSDLNLLQVHGSLLSNEENSIFYKKHYVVT